MSHEEQDLFSYLSGAPEITVSLWLRWFVSLDQSLVFSANCVYAGVVCHFVVFRCFYFVAKASSEWLCLWLYIFATIFSISWRKYVFIKTVWKTYPWVYITKFSWKILTNSFVRLTTLKTNQVHQWTAKCNDFISLSKQAINEIFGKTLTCR